MNKTCAIPIMLWYDVVLLLRRVHPKFECMFRIGVESGLRISDILSLSAGMFENNDTCAITVQEKKTKKMRTVAFNNDLWCYILNYIDLYGLVGDDKLVFRSDNLRSIAVSRTTAYRMLSRVSKSLNGVVISPHSMRRTYAKFLYESSGKDIEVVRRALNHSNIATTYLYLFG